MKPYLEEVIEIVSEFMRVPADPLNENSRFREDIGLDSLDDVEMVMEIERCFDVDISDEVFETWSTIGDACDFLAREIGGGQPSPKFVLQYYFRMADCTAGNSLSPECRCWHYEGTGPLANEPETAKEWRTAH